MPVEKRPSHPLPKGPRPGSRCEHHVTDDETLESVAKKYSVGVKHLIFHNFGTTNPAEINWYLHHRVGCVLPTHDEKNWRFSKKADPGVIYIPERQVIEMEPVVIIGKVEKGKVEKPKVDLDQPIGPPSFLASEKFAFEVKIPKDPKDIGYFRWQWTIAVEGEIKQQGGILKTTLKKGQVKLAVEKKLSDTVTVTFGAKVEEKSLKPIADAVAKGSKEDLWKAIFAPFEASIKKSFSFGKFAIVPEGGLEVSTVPVIIRVAGEYEDYMLIEGAPFKGKFVIKATCNLGLSVKGWAWVAEKVGKPVLQRFLTTGGRALTAVGEWLAAEGVIEGIALTGAVVAGAIVGTLALTYLCAWVVEDAKRKGELRGLATWYVSAYSAKVFGLNRPSGFIIGDVKLRDQLILLGEKDAAADARNTLVKAKHPLAQGSDAQVLDAFGRMLISESNGNYSTAKWKLEKTLEERSKKLAGL